MSEVVDQTGVSAAKGGVSRRSWSPAQKRRIVEEAYRPGASVADVARSHGLNANQVFNWRRRATAATPKAKNASLSAALVPQGEIAAASAATFLPLGTIARADGSEALLVLSPTASKVDRSVSDGPGSAGTAMDGRAGLIEIDLACGTRLRVDAFVNERALRRVLSVLKASP